MTPARRASGGCGRLRAVVLAAGFGTRLRPLTAELPKPLLPILGRPLLALTLERLAAAGVEAVAINLHHRAEAIPAALGDRFNGMPLVYSREDAILGTLGALHPLRDFLAPADLVLLVNGDSLCRWPFDELVAHHLETRRLATLLLSATADFGAFGGAAVDGAGRIVAFPVAARDAGGLLRAAAPPSAERDRHEREPASIVALRVFAGAHVFAPSLALEAPATLSDIVRDLYQPRLAAGARLETLSTTAPWHDLGTPARYLDAVLDWVGRTLAPGVGGGVDEAMAAAPVSPDRDAAIDRQARTSLASGSWIDRSARVDPSAVLERVVIEAGATVEPQVHGRAVLLMGGARLGRSSHLERVVVGPGVEIAAGASIENALVTPLEWGTVAGSRVEGSTVFTPLEPPPAAAEASPRRPSNAGPELPSPPDREPS